MLKTDTKTKTKRTKQNARTKTTKQRERRTTTATTTTKTTAKLDDKVWCKDVDNKGRQSLEENKGQPQTQTNHRPPVIIILGKHTKTHDEETTEERKCFFILSIYHSFYCFSFILSLIFKSQSLHIYLTIIRPNISYRTKQIWFGSTPHCQDQDQGVVVARRCVASPCVVLCCCYGEFALRCVVFALCCSCSRDTRRPEIYILTPERSILSALFRFQLLKREHVRSGSFPGQKSRARKVSLWWR